MSQDWLEQRLRTLRRESERNRSANLVNAWQQFRVAPSCPPDSRVHIRPGWMQLGTLWGSQEAIYYPSIAIDFSGNDQIDSGYTGNFSSPYFYSPIILQYHDDYFFGLLQGNTRKPCLALGGEPEYATPQEAEAALLGWFDGAFGENRLYWGTMPLCGIVLRNNGTTNMNYQVQPIDAVNRGRSYLWLDLRPLHNTIYYDGYY